MKSKPNKEKDYYKIIGLPTLVTLFIFSLLLMQSITAVRLKELKNNLQQVSEDDAIGRSLFLVSRYLLIKKRMRIRQDTADGYLAEGQLVAIMSGEFSDRNKSNDNILLEKPVLFLINSLNKILSLQPVGDLKEDQGRKLLEIAYFYERKREFTKAVKVYNAAIEYFKKSPQRKIYSLLHRGFCQSLLGNYDQALADYARVIQSDTQGEMGSTASFLSKFIQNVQSRLNKIDKMGLSVKKGAAYYHAMAYKKSITTLNKLAKRSTKQKLFFYRGRSYEELGMTKKAIYDYKKVLRINTQTALAKNANRRLYILGTYYTGSKKLKKISRNISRIQKDQKFFQKSKRIEKAVNTQKVAKLKKDITTVKTIAYINKKTDAKIKLPQLHKKKHKEPKTENKKKNTKKEKKAHKARRIRRNRLRRRTLRRVRRIAKPTKRIKETLPQYREYKKITKISQQTKTKIQSIVTDEQIPRDQRKKAFKKLRLVDKIYTIDGSVFTGIVLKQKNNILKMATVYGVIRIPTNDIIRRTQAIGKSAIR